MLRQAIRDGLAVAHVHLRHLNPLPPNLGDLLAQFDTVLVPELNNGQLATVLRDKLSIEVQQQNKVSGQPLTVGELTEQISALAPARMQEVQNHG